MTLVAGLTRDLVDRGLDARDWSAKRGRPLGRRGGGRPDLAEAGGKHPGKLPEALEAAAEWFRGRWPAARRGKKLETHSIPKQLSYGLNRD